MEREALKLALEALGKAKRQIVHAKVAPHECIGDAITAIKEALAQEPKSVTYNEVADSMNSLRKGNLSQQAAAEEVGKLKLYTAPPQRPWVGMPEDEKEKFVIAYYPSNWDRKTAVALMNNYEAYLKEKNT